MTRFTLALLAGTLAACAAGSDPTPEPYVGVDQADLQAAEMSPSDTVLTDAESADPSAIPFAPAAEDSMDRAVIDAEGAPTVPKYGRVAIVAVRWGYFPPRPADEWVDFSGFVAVSSGQVKVLRTLRFEGDDPARPYADFVKPDDDPRVVRFRSHTKPAWDGLLLAVRRPELRPDVLVIQVGDTRRVLPFEELFDLDASETLTVAADAGHELRIRAHVLASDAGACAVQAGEAAGRWKASDDGTGLFRAQLDAAGATYGVAGHTRDARGPYGRFRGEVVAADGSAAGLLGGYYAAFHYSPGAGVLVGRLRSDDEALKGAVLGRWQLDGSEGAFRARLLQRDPACTTPAD